jgi:23S rRNA pseudouridine1911/1915/1917 synthase
MSVQPLTRKETGTLMNGVVARWPECIGVGDSPLMAGALHRIDSGTSGLVLVARNAMAFENLRSQFSVQTVKKTYLALVEGAVAFGGTLENDLVHMPGLGYCRMVDLMKGRLSESERRALASKALHAVTSYTPLGMTREGNEERTLLEVTIYTGVTHQIRAQLSSRRAPIVGDKKYGSKDHGTRFPALFSYKLSLCFNEKNICHFAFPDIKSYPWNLFDPKIYEELKK